MRTNLPVADVRATAGDVLLQHDAVQTSVEKRCDDAKKSKAGHGPIGDSFRSLWAHLSKPEVVASTPGWQNRRIVLSAISGPSTAYAAANAFVGGNLSREAFLAAKTRRAEATKMNDVLLL